MKIVETVYSYKYSAMEILSGLKNKIIDAVNGSISSNFKEPESSSFAFPSYYERNRKISKAIDDMFETLNCEFHLNREAFYSMKSDDAHKFVKYRMASMITDELMKSDKLIIVEQNNHYEIVYRIEIPFLKSKYITQDFDKIKLDGLDND